MTETRRSRVAFDFTPLLEHYGESRGIRLCLDVDHLPTLPALLRECLPSGPRWQLVFDHNTWRVAGERVLETVTGDGHAPAITCTELGSALHRSALRATVEEAEALQSQFESGGVSAAIAVGSGTINDLVKMAAFGAGIPCACVATAPSMNGYTSSAASLLDAGIKVTRPCSPPVLCFADTEVLRRAPMRMVQSGFGDLLSRPVSGADWYLSHVLEGTPYDTKALELIHQAEKLMRELSGRLTEGDTTAIAALTAALWISGLAMDVAGTSAPSSGGEHLISHYLDMTAFAHGLPYDLHGCQVGVSTLISAHLYRRLLELEADDLEPAHELLEWRDKPAELKKHFGPLWPSLRDDALTSIGTAEGNAHRLQRLRERWPEIRANLRSLLRTPDEIREDLIKARAPTSFCDLDISEMRAHNAVRFARYIRPRYSILDLAEELGRLEVWLHEALAEMTR
ncbi:MAG: iron-containing alcohol dehydrogenase [Candidatus Latescibacterota bacterium]|nr:iron-containing alcohol dehydrogenase [Candidatus Latescibacterota bacterium]